MYIRTSGHVGEYYGPNFSCTESTSYPEKKEKARNKFMNFNQKYMGSVFFFFFFGHSVYVKCKALLRYNNKKCRYKRRMHAVL